MDVSFPLGKAEMRRIEPFFPRPHGMPRVDDRCVVRGSRLTQMRSQAGSAKGTHACFGSWLNGRIVKRLGRHSTTIYQYVHAVEGKRHEFYRLLPWLRSGRKPRRLRWWAHNLSAVIKHGRTMFRPCPALASRPRKYRRQALTSAGPCWPRGGRML